MGGKPAASGATSAEMEAGAERHPQCQERLDTAPENETSLGQGLFSCSGVRTGLPSCILLEHVMFSLHMHTKLGRKPIFMGTFVARCPMVL